MVRSTMGKVAGMNGDALGLWRVAYVVMTIGLALLLASGVAHAAVPDNDNLANAQQIIGADAGITGDNVEATKERYEPDHAGNDGGMSVWYKWTPQSDGSATVSTSGSDFDTLLGVYVGSAMSSLSTVASNDDDGTSVQGTSQVSFLADGGTTYYIAVDSPIRETGNGEIYGPYPGEIQLYLSSDTDRPAHDKFANAQQITGTEATLTGTNQDATKESGEPNHAGNRGGMSVWYKWTPQKSAETTIDTFGSDFATLLAVYTGSSVQTLSEIASNDDAESTTSLSQVNFRANAGITYRIAVDGDASCCATSSGDINLNLATDTTAPNAPVIINPPEGTYVNDGSFTISGRAEGNSTVELFEGTTSKGTGTADSNGDWSIGLTGVADGSHSYTAKATDASENTSAASGARSVNVDTIAPNAPVITSPSGSSYDNDGAFTVSGRAEANSTVKLFEGTTFKGTDTADSNGIWSINLTGLADGSHSYTAKATDAANNTSAASSARTVIVDGNAPSVKRVAPVENATGIAPGANVSALFSEAMNPTSIKSAFKLYKKGGSTTALEATVTYDVATKRAVLNPNANLERGATYKAVVTTGARDLAGNLLDQNPTLTGTQPKAWSFTISP